jgi:hypothetical protein
MPHDKPYLKDGHPQEYHHQVGLAAESMIERYGNQASSEAANRATELDVIGDVESADMWRDITKKLQSPSG